MSAKTVSILPISLATKRFTQFVDSYGNDVTIYSTKLGDLAFVTVSPEMFWAIKDTSPIVIMDADKMLYLIGHYKLLTIFYDGQNDRLFLPVDREIENNVYIDFWSMLLFYDNETPRFSTHKIEEFVADKTRKIKNNNIKKEGDKIKLLTENRAERITLEASEKDVFMDVTCAYLIYDRLTYHGEIIDKLAHKLYGTEYKVFTEFKFVFDKPYRLTADGSRKPLYNYVQTEYLPIILTIDSIIPVNV